MVTRCTIRYAGYASSVFALDYWVVVSNSSNGSYDDITPEDTVHVVEMALDKQGHRKQEQRARSRSSGGSGAGSGSGNLGGSGRAANSSSTGYLGLGVGSAAADDHSEFAISPRRSRSWSAGSWHVLQGVCMARLLRVQRPV